MQAAVYQSVVLHAIILQEAARAAALNAIQNMRVSPFRP